MINFLGDSLDSPVWVVQATSSAVVCFELRSVEFSSKFHPKLPDAPEVGVPGGLTATWTVCREALSKKGCHMNGIFKLAIDSNMTQAQRCTRFV